ncbi:efflux RND transporter periplasmic adaptor subunit [Marinobacter sp.]|uniref:efflux RND transporter periplasmic adaptor subunit n=1 Tax=Marinobacter sp. TaxID=50741 RepID=UPI00384DE91A
MPAGREGSQSPERKSRFIWGLAGLAVLVLGLLVFWLLQALAPRPEAEPPELAPLAEFAPVEPVGSRLALPVEGFVRARARISLVSEVSGRITQVAEGLVSGGRFREGDLLVQIDREPFEADVADARASVSRAEAELKNARDQLARIRKLETRDFSAEAQLDDAEVNEQRAASALEQARANLANARIRLDDTRIHAPFDSEIIAEEASLGRFVSPGEEIAQLFATDFGEIRVGLSLNEAALVARANGRAGYSDLVGTAAEVRVSSADTAAAYEGFVAQVEPAVDRQARTVNLVVRVDGAFTPDGDRPRLLLDDLVDVRLELTGRSDWWHIPATALKQPGRVWRLREDQTLEPIDVEVLFRPDDRAVIQTGQLGPEDRLLLTDLASPVAGLEVRPRERDQE